MECVPARIACIVIDNASSMKSFARDLVHVVVIDHVVVFSTYYPLFGAYVCILR